MHCPRENIHEYPRDIASGILIIVYLSTFHGLKIINCILEPVLALYSLATHTPNFVISSQDFHIGFVKIVIDLKNS